MAGRGPGFPTGSAALLVGHGRAPRHDAGDRGRRLPARVEVAGRDPATTSPRCRRPCPLRHRSRPEAARRPWAPSRAVPARSARSATSRHRAAADGEASTQGTSGRPGCGRTHRSVPVGQDDGRHRRHPRMGRPGGPLVSQGRPAGQHLRVAHAAGEGPRLRPDPHHRRRVGHLVTAARRQDGSRRPAGGPGAVRGRSPKRQREGQPRLLARPGGDPAVRPAVGRRPRQTRHGPGLRVGDGPGPPPGGRARRRTRRSQPPSRVEGPDHPGRRQPCLPGGDEHLGTGGRDPILGLRHGADGGVAVGRPGRRRRLPGQEPQPRLAPRRPEHPLPVRAHRGPGASVAGLRRACSTIWSSRSSCGWPPPVAHSTRRC